MRFGKMPSSCVSARRAPSKETLAGFFGWLLAGLAWLLAGFPGWLSGWLGLASGWFGLLLAGFLAVWFGLAWLAGLVWLLAGFLAVWFGSCWLLAGLAWLSFFPCFSCLETQLLGILQAYLGLLFAATRLAQRFRLQILCRTRSNAGRTSARSLSGRIESI